VGLKQTARPYSGDGFRKPKMLHSTSATSFFYSTLIYFT